MFDFRLTDAMNPRTAARVIDHLGGPRQMVPSEDYGTKHDEWLERTEPRLISGEAHALFATFGRVAAGAVVFRPEPDNPTIFGIRNISIHPNFKGRRVASFALRNAELLMRDINPDVAEIIVDTKTTNLDMIAFLESQGYTPKEIVDLYGSDKLDVVLSKTLRSQDEVDDPQPTGGRSTRLCLADTKQSPCHQAPQRSAQVH